MSYPNHYIPRREHQRYLAKFGDKLDGNLVLPHTIEASKWDDPYKAGDVYDQISQDSVREWTLPDPLIGPYLRHVKNVSKAWPQLRYLADWMEVTTSPAKWALIRDREAVIRQERASRTNIAAMDFNRDGNVTVDSIKDLDSLRRSLQELEATCRPDVSRLYVVEDLSRDVIEALGSSLDVDPLFFRGQISDYHWYNTRDAWVELPELQVVALKRSHFCLRYDQPRYFKSQRQYEEALKKAAEFNVLRRVDDDRNHTPVLDEPGTVIGFVRGRSSFWSKAAEGGRAGAVGILLVDPTIKKGFHLWSGLPNFEATPSIRHQGCPDVPPTESLFESVIFWTRRMKQRDIEAIFTDRRAMMYRITQIICTEWLTICQYIRTRLGQIEWELENPDFLKQNKSIDIPLSKLQVWRRGIPVYQIMVAEAIETLFQQRPEMETADCIADLRQDYENVQKTLADIIHNIEQIVTVATSTIEIKDARRSFSQNESLARLSWLASIFAPLTFVCGVFSMENDLSTMKRTFWIYFCVAVPFTVIAFVVVSTPGRRLIKMMKNFWGDQSEE